MIMLDTNICIYILQKHPIHIKEKFNAIETVHISSIVYAELQYGIEYGSKRLRAAREKQLNQFLTLLTIHDWDKRAAEQYGKVNAFLRKKGMMIGNMDMLIAAHALSLKATLVTNNGREFQRIPDLMVENWHSE